MNKIQLTLQDEHLLPWPKDRTEDCKLALELCIGVHEHCNGWVHITQVSESHRVLHCKHCAFRLLIPIEVDTWKKLEFHMRDVIINQGLKQVE